MIQPQVKPFPVALAFRDMTKDDVGYVINSWIQSYKWDASRYPRMDSTEGHGMIRKNYYYYGQNWLIHAILKRSQILIACDEVDNNYILGYLIYQALSQFAVIHYIFVRETVQGNGLATALVKSVKLQTNGVTMASHWTKHFHHIGKRCGVDYNPYMQFGSEYLSSKKVELHV